MDSRPEIQRRVRAAKRVLLFLDYDGTLVPIQPSPELARLNFVRRRLLGELARQSKFKVGLLTGRSLRDIRRAVDIPGLFFAANYGLAIATPKKNWVHPGARRRVPLLRKLRLKLARLEQEFPRVCVEDKTLTVAIHYRQYRGKPGLLKSRLEEILRAHPRGFRLKTGKRIFEIYPAVAWDKGRAVVKVRRMLGFTSASLAVFLGDDRADEAAFAKMQNRDITAAVGRRKNTAARFFCRNSGDVIRFLEFLLEIGKESKPGG